MGNKLSIFKKRVNSTLKESILNKSFDDEYIELEDCFSESSHGIFGCRSPQSTGVGKWDGAFIYIDQHRTKPKVAIIYDNNMKYVTKNIPLKKAIKQSPICSITS